MEKKIQKSFHRKNEQLKELVANVYLFDAYGTSRKVVSSGTRVGSESGHIKGVQNL